MTDLDNKMTMNEKYVREPYCPICGQKLGDDDLYCPNCSHEVGKPVEDDKLNAYKKKNNKKHGAFIGVIIAVFALSSLLSFGLFAGLGTGSFKIANIFNFSKIINKSDNFKLDLGDLIDFKTNDGGEKDISARYINETITKILKTNDGYTVTAQGESYGGKLIVDIYFDNQAVITNVVPIECNDTPGIGGDNFTVENIKELYVGKSLNEKVDLRVGATITSKTMLDLTSAAQNALKQITGN